MIIKIAVKAKINPQNAFSAENGVLYISEGAQS
jgi:hypothetical protein